MARWTCLCAVLFATLAFAITGERLLHANARSTVMGQAEICAAALTTGPDRELWASVDKLRSRYQRLAGVALLDVAGNPQTVYPGDPAYHAAVAATLDAKGAAVATTTRLAGHKQTLWGVALPLNGDSSPSARRAVFLLTLDPSKGTLLAATAGFGCAALLAILVGSILVTRWFDRRVTRPLHNLAKPILTPTDGLEISDTAGWRETGRIADRLRNLARGLVDSEAENRHLENEMFQKLQARQRGFDHRLRRAEDRATTDPLTGLRNRTFLDAELEPLLHRQRARDEDLSVVMMDVDDFKSYNDALGHKAGDELLRFIGELLRGTIRPTDHGVRYGGDEFLLLLPGADGGQALPIAERIVKLFAQYVSRLDGNVRLSISAGVASLGDGAEKDGLALVADADRALYAAKRAGKNTVAAAPVG